MSSSNGFSNCFRSTFYVSGSHVARWSTFTSAEIFTRTSKIFAEFTLEVPAQRATCRRIGSVNWIIAIMAIPTEISKFGVELQVVAYHCRTPEIS